ncbi:MAG: hypothetical protein V1668_01745 [Patescibacteria group bacterium]
MDNKKDIITEVQTGTATSTKITLGISIAAGIITAAAIILALTNIK